MNLFLKDDNFYLLLDNNVYDGAVPYVYYCALADNKRWIKKYLDLSWIGIMEIPFPHNFYCPCANCRVMWSHKIYTVKNNNKILTYNAFTDKQINVLCGNYSQLKELVKKIADHFYNGNMPESRVEITKEEF